MEIIFSDDCSTDNTFEMIQEETVKYRGPHKVVAIRNTTNLGVVKNLNKAMDLASGEVIVVAGGDDVSEKDRVTELVNRIGKNGVQAAYSNAELIDHSGRYIRDLYLKRTRVVTNSCMEIAKRGSTRIAGCTLAWHRRVFDIFGPLPEYLDSEDQVIPFRAALLGEIAYIDRKLVSYRIHERNLSHWTHVLRTGNLDETRTRKVLQLRRLCANEAGMLDAIERIVQLGPGDIMKHISHARDLLQSRLTIDKFRLRMIEGQFTLGDRVREVYKLLTGWRTKTAQIKTLLSLLAVALAPRVYLMAFRWYFAARETLRCAFWKQS